jgi:hypothetical protein
MSKLWWKAAGRRAIKTFAQTIISTGVVIGAISAGTDWMSVAWTAATVVLSAIGAAGLSLLNSIAGLPELECDE